MCQVSMATKCCMVLPNICGSSVWSLLLVTWNFQLAPRFLGKSVRPFPKFPTHPSYPDTFLSTVASRAAYLDG